MLKLEGKVAVVTGGNSGIGLAVARRLAEEGAYVFIAGRRQTQLDEAVRAIGGRVEAVQCDVTKADDLDRLFETVKGKSRGLDILVVASGISEFATLDTTTDEHFDRLFSVNVRGLVFTVQRAVQQMANGSSIVLIGSIAASVGNPGFGTYSATKAAVQSYARSWSKELAGRGIRINVVSPGPIDTPMFDNVSDEVRRTLTNLIPMSRLGTPEEVANTVLFLASADSTFVTGAELRVDGGMTA
ncbi:SDR family oxidoreductase [Paraburkholderia sp. UYCP14C]|uniref:SDR family NAD(P)-dependent oxidoreductase n=1 Tax=Paraburkholderia sp. UYCP14C TaxID=2511130 RepID=UPI00101FDBD7|nr:SDR family oxidoreductase [Paraburkholderia sp. UYCP14C]RZF28494.1 SDR family oxidoreductase [Paraburkholderia sp. UYCP14C]